MMTHLRQYLCERCGGTGQQPEGCWNGTAYAAPAGVCDDCDGAGVLGNVMPNIAGTPEECNAAIDELKEGVETPALLEFLDGLKEPK